MSNGAWLCLWLVAAASCWAAPADDRWVCAPGCLCSQDGLSAECTGGIPRPSGLPGELVALSLRAHQLRAVDAKTFAALPKLQQLDLSDGRLSEVTADAFSTLPQLQSLRLSNNELTFLPSDAFSSNPALAALDLSSNPLVLPSIGPFLRSSSLSELRLADCMMRRYTPDSFVQLPSLRVLDLTSNSFSNLTSEAVEPFMNLDRLYMDEDALTEDALAFLQRKGVEVIQMLNDTTEGDLQPEDQEEGIGHLSIYLGFLDKDYLYEEAAVIEDNAVPADAALMEPERQWYDDQTQTGASEVERWVRHPSWKLVVYSVLLVATTCVTAALAYWATVLVIRRRAESRAAQGSRATLDRAFRQVASLPAYKTLQKEKDKQKEKAAGGRGYHRLVEEEDAPSSLPPRAAQPERCSCLSCSEPVPTQPCIRFYEGPASVHGAPPAQYYTLYNQ